MPITMKLSLRSFPTLIFYNFRPHMVAVYIQVIFEMFLASNLAFQNYMKWTIIY